MGSHPDFSGSWLFYDYNENGETDGFWNLLTSYGMPWYKRMVAYLMSYGKGRSIMEIKQNGDKVGFTQKTVLGDVIANYIIGGGQQEVKDPTGIELFIEPVWEGDVLVIASTKKAGGAGPTLRRSLKSDNAMEYTMELDGHKVIQTWTQQ